MIARLARVFVVVTMGLGLFARRMHGAQGQAKRARAGPLQQNEGEEDGSGTAQQRSHHGFRR